MNRIVPILFAAAVLSAQAADPRAPLVPLYDAAGATRACDEGLARVKKTIDAMAARKGAGAIFAEWNRLFIEIEDASNALSLYATIHPNAAVRAASEACDQKFTSLNTELYQNEKLYARVKAVAPGNPKQAKLQRDLLQGFEDSGVSLPAAKRAT